MKQYDKLLFVCKSNTELSPMAEAIAQKLLLLEDILIESKGLVVLFPEPVNPKVEAILAGHGLSMKEHLSSQFTEDDFDPRTLVLAMDERQKEKMLEDYRQPQNLYTLVEYLGLEETIQDPYGGALADYGACFEQLEGILARLADKIKEEDN